MRALDGVAVLVTRPRQQATPLCRLLESRGASVLQLAAIQVEAVTDLHAVMLKTGSIDTFDLIIFTSANAVKFGAALLGAHRDLKLAAIGPATARALEQTGQPAAAIPQIGFDSEALLLLPELSASPGRSVLIIKGVGGRQLLQEQLAKRGMRVAVAEVYERVRSAPAPAELAVLELRFASHEIQVVTATSVEIVAALIALATPAIRREFENVHWLVPSARVATSVRERGVMAPILLADSAADHDLVEALVRWRSSESGE